MIVAIVSAGEMGSAIGARLRESGHRVLTPVGDRSGRTTTRAEAAGLEFAATLDEALSIAELCLSVVPPGSAYEVAREVASAARRRNVKPLFVDLNAVAPGTIAAIQRELEPLELVDGAISGPPPATAGTTRIYLAGRDAPRVAELLSPLASTVVVGPAAGSASAVKMCTASLYKGTVALLAQALRTADAHGVVQHVLDDLAVTGHADPERAGRTLARGTAKAWRYVGEMHEIAATQSEVGLPGELFEAFAIVYAELATHGTGLTPGELPDELAVETVLEHLRGGGAISAEA